MPIGETTEEIPFIIPESVKLKTFQLEEFSFDIEEKEGKSSSRLKRVIQEQEGDGFYLLEVY